jgi:hypothetical protein
MIDPHSSLHQPKGANTLTPEFNKEYQLHPFSFQNAASMGDGALICINGLFDHVFITICH